MLRSRPKCAKAPRPCGPVTPSAFSTVAAQISDGRCVRRSSWRSLSLSPYRKEIGPRPWRSIRFTVARVRSELAAVLDKLDQSLARRAMERRRARAAHLADLRHFEERPLTEEAVDLVLVWALRLNGRLSHRDVLAYRVRRPAYSLVVSARQGIIPTRKQPCGLVQVCPSKCPSRCPSV